MSSSSAKSIHNPYKIMLKFMELTVASQTKHIPTPFNHLFKQNNQKSWLHKLFYTSHEVINTSDYEHSISDEP